MRTVTTRVLFTALALAAAYPIGRYVAEALSGSVRLVETLHVAGGVIN